MSFDRSTHALASICLVICVASIPTGCADTPLATDTGLGVEAPAQPQPQPSGGVDEDAILSRLSKFRSSPDFVRINQNPYPSALDPEKMVNVYVSVEGWEAFAGIAPEEDGSGLEVPEGTLIVREIQQPIGVVTTLTLMYKGPPGYNPDLNDFWFGVTDPYRTPLVEDGLRMVGELQDCYGCHLARPDDGHLFGVPFDNRSNYQAPE
jgi:hypothetical protein